MLCHDIWYDIWYDMLILLKMIRIFLEIELSCVQGSPPVDAMRALLTSASLTLIAFVAFTGTSRNMFSPAVVSAPSLPYAVAPAASVQRIPLNVYG